VLIIGLSVSGVGFMLGLGLGLGGLAGFHIADYFLSLGAEILSLVFILLQYG